MLVMLHYAFDCAIEGELSRESVQQWLEETPASLGLTRISPAIVSWDCPVVSGMCVLAESHLSFHADLANRWANVDCFVCAEIDPAQMRTRLSYLGLNVRRQQTVDRGPVPESQCRS